jgi:hypothetical protein
MFIFWIGIQISNIKTLPINYMWGIGINGIPTLGGIFGIFIALRWGGFKSALGKALMYISIGLLSWAAGNWIWSYYNFVEHNNIPYPSLADALYIIAFGLWAVGMWHLAKATGARYGLKKHRQLYVFILPVIIFAISYYLLVTVARNGQITSGGGALKVFFDFAYPLVDVIIVTIALLIYSLSLKYLGGKFKWPVLIVVLGFVLNFFTDFYFSYSTTIGTYFNGSFSDLLFVISLFVICFGISSFDIKTD